MGSSSSSSSTAITDDENRYCSSIFFADPVQLGNTQVGAALCAVGFTFLFMSLINIYWIKRQEVKAKKGSDSAVKSVIFPVFVAVLWANAAINVYVGIITLTLAYHFNPTKRNQTGPTLAFCVMWGFQHCITEGVAFLLMNKGLGWNTATLVLKRVSVWGAVVFSCQLFIYSVADELPSFALAVSLIWQGILLFFYAALWFAPSKRLFRRPSVKLYAQFWTVFRVLSIIVTIMEFLSVTRDVSECLFVYGLLLTFGLLEPPILYFTLLQDSKWWQGLEVIQSSDPNVEAIRSPLAGIDLNLKSAQTLANAMDTMGVENQVASKKAVRLLNFAYITLDRSRYLGSGSFSKVYRGTYRSATCAVKMIFTLDLTAEVIKRVAAEAQILSQIQHANIVKIFGVSVLPPSVCILLELCEFGSLADVVKGTISDSGESVRGPAKLLLSRADRFFLALGCARGLAALHEYSPDLCHRDVKSFNFLVDKHFNSKIADLELGVSKDIAATTGNISERKSTPEPDGFHMEDLLPNWAAPEVLRGQRYTQASDVYSFALVLWEIISGAVPFSAVDEGNDKTRKGILAGNRPSFPATFADDRSPYAHYVALVTRGWQDNPNFRPLSEEFVAELECIWHNECHNLLVDTDKFPDAPLSEFLRYRRRMDSSQSTSRVADALFGTSHSAVRSEQLQSDASAALRSVCHALDADDNLRAIDGDSGAWLLVTAQSPHIVLRCNPSWQELAWRRNTADVIGRPLGDVMAGPKTDRTALDDVCSGQADTIGAQGYGHANVTLYKYISSAQKPKRSNPGFFGLGWLNADKSSVDNISSRNRCDSDSDSDANDSNGSGRKTNRDVVNDELSDESVYSLFSVHSFPIMRRQSPIVGTNLTGDSPAMEIPSHTSGDANGSPALHVVPQSLPETLTLLTTTHSSPHSMSPHQIQAQSHPQSQQVAMATSPSTGFMSHIARIASFASDSSDASSSFLGRSFSNAARSPVLTTIGTLSKDKDRNRVHSSNANVAATTHTLVPRPTTLSGRWMSPDILLDDRDGEGSVSSNTSDPIACLALRFCEVRETSAIARMSALEKLAQQERKQNFPLNVGIGALTKLAGALGLDGTNAGAGRGSGLGSLPVSREGSRSSSRDSDGVGVVKSPV